MELNSKHLCNKADWRKAVIRNVYIRVVIVSLLCAAVGLITPAYFIYNKKGGLCDCECMSLEFRINCLPSTPITQQTKETCYKMRCCWQFINDSQVPPCFHKHPTDTEYYIVSSSNTSFLTAKLKKNTSSASYSKLNMKIGQYNEHHIRVSIFGEEDEPDYPIFSQKEPPQTGSNLVETSKQRERLSIKVRRDNGKVLFDTTFGPLIYRHSYIEFSTYVPSYNLYGLGQARRRKFGFDFVESEQWTLYSRYRSNENETDHFPGVHPFYLCVEENGDAHGVLLETARPMELILTAGPLLTIRIVGGIFDAHFFLGPSPTDVIRQMQSYIGRPTLPPYWALGHHVCNSVNLSDAKSRAEELRKKRGAQESDCGSSLIYQQEFSQHKDQLLDFFQFLFENHQKRLVIDTPYVPVIDKYNQVYINCPFSEKGAFGYLDFFNEGTIDYIEDKYSEMEDDGIFSDGVLLDYNTPVNFDKDGTKCDDDHFEFLPGGTSLSSGTICWNCSHGNLTHYKLHNLHGHKHIERVWNVLKSKNRGHRQFILSLSTFLGSGQYGGSWGGPNNASWEDLRQAVADMIEYSSFGIPMSGAPYCGYYGANEQDLCSRWLQVASLSPLTIGYRGPGEEPVNLIDNGLISSVGRMAIRLKYSLLPYLYSLFYRAHLYGDTVVRPLFFEFPKDANTYHLDSQYMWGPSLLVSPVLTPKTQKINAYFPKGCWYDYHVGTKYNLGVGKHKLLPAIESHINLHVRGGHIIPGRTAGLTVAESLKNNFILTVALNVCENLDICDEEQVLASGEFYIDDGISQGSSYVVVKVRVQNSTLTTTSTWYPEEGVLGGVSYKLELIRLFGLLRNPSKIEINGIPIEDKFSDFVEKFKSLSIKGQSLNLLSNNTIRWEHDICK